MQLPLYYSFFTTASLLLPLYIYRKMALQQKRCDIPIYILLYIYIQQGLSERRIAASLPQHLYCSIFTTASLLSCITGSQVNGLKRGFSERRIAAFNFFVRDMVGKIRQDDPSIEHQARQTYAYIALHFVFLGGRLAKSDKMTPLLSTRQDRHKYIYSVLCFFWGGKRLTAGCLCKKVRRYSVYLIYWYKSTNADT